jgi:hypothetical protein
VTLRASTLPLDASAIANAQVLSVANIDSPTELNSRAGGTNGAICIVTQNIAGANAWTLYCFDSASSAGVSTPKIMAASGSGQWIAVAGKYCNSPISAGALTSSALTATRVPFSGTAGLLSDSADMTFASASGALTLGNATATHTISSTTASSSTSTGALVVAGGGAFAGKVYFGSTLTAAVNSGSTLNLDLTDTAASRTVAMFRVNTSATAHTSAPLFDVISAASTSSDKMVRVRANSVDVWTMAADGTGTWSGPQSFTNATASSSTSTGALVVSGGVGVAKDVRAAQAILSSGATSGIGYATGAGGTVTQATSKATGVTLSTVCGTITTNAASLASATNVSFVLTNTAIAATDVVVIVHDSVGTLGGYGITATPAAGSATITIRNNTAGALAEAIVLRFAVIKAVIA